MKRDFFYYKEPNGSIEIFSANRFRDGEGRLIVSEEFMRANGFRLGYRARVDIGRENGSCKIRVPEAENGCPVTMVMITSMMPDDVKLSDIGYPIIEYMYIPSGVRMIRCDIAASGNMYETGGAAVTLNMLDGCRVEISPDNPYFCADEAGIYSKDRTELVYILSHGEIPEIPEGIKRIKRNACGALKGLRRLVIPESVVEIEHGAFKFCPVLTEAEIRAEKLGKMAFQGCRALATARIYSKEIDKGAFYGCTALENVQLENTVSIGSNVFLECKSLSKLTLPDTVRHIGSQAFAGAAIKRLTIPPDTETLEQDIAGAAIGLKVFMKNGLLPFRKGICPVRGGVSLDVYSFETGELLFRAVDCSKIGSVFTDRGMDTEEYDRILSLTISKRGGQLTEVSAGNLDPGIINTALTKWTVKAAAARLEYPYKLSGEMTESLTDFLLLYAETVIRVMIRDRNASAYEVFKAPELEKVNDEGLLRLITESAELGKPEVTAVLMQKLHDRKNNE